MPNTKRTPAPSRGQITDEEIDEIREIMVRALVRGTVEATPPPKSPKVREARAS